MLSDFSRRGLPCAFRRRPTLQTIRLTTALASRWAVLASVRRPGDALLLLRIFGVAVAVSMLMRLPLARVQALLEPRRVPPRPTPAQEDRLVATVLAVLQAGRPLVRRGCLTRGVTLYYALRRAGVPVTLRFGVGVSAGQADGFDGHCWLVKDGMPFLEARDPRPLYIETYMMPWARRLPQHGA